MKTKLILSSGLTACSVFWASPLTANAQSLNESVPLYESTHHTGWSYPETHDQYSAQPFLTGDHGVVSSITMQFIKVGNPGGELRFEIWDRKENLPGSKVASVGELDLAALPETWESVTLNKDPITDLKPNSVYYVVANFADVDIGTGGNDSIGARHTTNPEGIGGVQGFVALIDNEWVPVGELLGEMGDVYWHMTMLESADDLPRYNTEITSIRPSGESISLTWNSRPFRTYSIDFSTSLEGHSWLEIEDGIESTSFETSFEDSDGERLEVKEGYYRVRLED